MFRILTFFSSTSSQHEHTIESAAWAGWWCTECD